MKTGLAGTNSTSMLPGGVDKVLAEHLRTTEGIELLGIDKLKVAERGFSTIASFEARTTNGTRPLFVKKIRHTSINDAITKGENQAVVEYNILNFLWPRFEGIPGCRVPKPLFVVPDTETIVMEYVNGIPLDNILDRSLVYGASRRRFSEVKDYFRLIGSWLKQFQEFTGSEVAGLEAFDSTLEKMETRLLLLERSDDPRIPKGIRNKVMRYLDIHIYPVVKDIRITGRHGDFGPWNILVEGEGIVVIDFLGYRKDIPSIDRLKMTQCFNSLRSRFAFSRTRIDELEKHFIDGYGDIPEIPEELDKFCRISMLISDLHACILNPGSNQIRRVERRREFKKNLYWLYNLMHQYIYYVRP